MAKKEAPAPEGERNSSNSIFWRTFLMLMVLIVVSVLGGLQTYWTFNEESIARSISQQIVSMTNLTRYALISADPVYRPDLLNILASEEGLRIVPKEDSDHTTPLTDTSTVSLIEQMVHEGLGPHTVLASEVNGEKGLWVSLSIDGDQYWLMTRKKLFDRPSGTSWLWWGIIAFMLSTLGATLAMLVSRYLLRDWVQRRFAAQMSTIDAGMDRDGARYLFALRLMPLFPFFLVNLLMGLTRLRVRHYWWVSQLAMLPATVIYLNAGRELGKLTSLRDILSPGLLFAFTLLGLLPLVTRWLFSRYIPSIKK